MIRDITIGQYYPSESVMHRLDPRVKLFGTLLFVVSLFIVNSFLGYIIATIFLGAIIYVSKIPLSFIMKGLKAIILLLLLSVAFNLFLTKGEIVFQIWIIKITKEGIRLAVFLAVRLIYVIVGSSLMTLTTTPNDLTSGLEKSLHILNKVKFPIHEMAMMMSIALRFIPILVDETDKIMKAQIARGADFESGNILKRAKSLIPILIPLFISSFRRATDLATAMEARCYHGGEGRTKMKPLKYAKRDGVAYAVIILFLVVVLAESIIVPRIPALSIFVV
ncbi:energy-coupling factor transporter transmembrane component T family protein [Parasporobacterium paucivorans]|uniref:Energy-coupling factor transport system permease protein n=1 Tax=Parasporobacterium paucivorans DSM 15970 TaxID=1122934 RepID=A0A1M6BLT5_9FIRM|nr:energy-coupling factor transporter transmembrane component T [Parasporobacterium paucivorans]SHI49685.1 energy-coupling factor transport system permease protein [Parasporobacterium paucivorans DSM 15970]